MYDALMLRTVARVMLPVLLLVSLFLLVRGHNLPGGGFIGGLLGAAAILLQIVAFGPARARELIPVDYLRLAALGVIFAALWGVAGLAAGQAFLQAFWIEQPVPGIGKLGTPVLFDVGVYLAVIGVTAQLALALAEEPSLFPQRPRPTSAERAAPEA